jgi:hypothetical protein
MNLETVPTDLLMQAKFMRIIDTMFSSTPISKADLDFIDAIDVELFSRGSELGTKLADTL